MKNEIYLLKKSINDKESYQLQYECMSVLRNVRKKNTDKIVFDFQCY